jgi:hypothetical protein
MNSSQLTNFETACVPVPDSTRRSTSARRIKSKKERYMQTTMRVHGASACTSDRLGTHIIEQTISNRFRLSAVVSARMIAVRRACATCRIRGIFPFSNKHLPLNLMSSTHTTSSSSSFHSIIINALEEYEGRTKKNLRSHPLAEQLQTCSSPGAILLVLQQQVRETNQSQSGDEMLTKWLDSTVKVLYAFTEALGEGVSLVCPKCIFHYDLHTHFYLFGRSSHLRKRSL